MRFLHGSLKAHIGDMITVQPSAPTRVLIMTDREFNKYKNNMSFTYYGGHKDDAYKFTIPKSGTWKVVIEKGTVNAPVDLTANISITRGAAKRLAASSASTPPPAEEPEAENEVPTDIEE